MPWTIMSVFLQLNCTIQDKTAREAMESYMAILEKAFKQYQNLWEDYIKLQEEHKQCNMDSSSQVVADEADMKNELIYQGQLNDNRRIEYNNISSVELDTSHKSARDFDINKGYASSTLNEPSHKGMDNNTPPKSPILVGKCLRNVKTFMKKPKCSPNIPSNTKIRSVHNPIPDINISYINDKTSSEYNKRLGISTIRHVETTFLPNGKKLKQSQLISYPAQHNEKKTLPNTDKLKSSSVPWKIKAKSPSNDTFIGKTSLTKKDNTTDIDETFSEDVIELSPTQRNVQSKVRNRLKLKRKVPVKQIVKSSPNENKYYAPDLGNAAQIIIDKADFALCSSSKCNSKQIETHEPLIKNSSEVNTLKEKNNVNNFSPIRKHNDIDTKINKSTEAQKIYQSVEDKIQNISQDSNNFTYGDETFFLSAQQVINEDRMHNFYPNDTENKPPAKRMLLDSFDALPKARENIPEHLNMRCRADRLKLNGWDCWECKEYYKNLSLSKEELQKRKNQCSRHRYRYERPNTPDGFWDPEFPETSFSISHQNIK